MKQLSMLSDLVTPKSAEIVSGQSTAGSSHPDQDSVEVGETGLLSFPGLLSAKLVGKDASTLQVADDDTAGQGAQGPPKKQGPITLPLPAQPEQNQPLGPQLTSRLGQIVMATVRDSTGELSAGTEAGKPAQTGEWSSAGDDPAPASDQAAYARFILNNRPQRAHTLSHAQQQQSGPGAGQEAFPSVPRNTSSIINNSNSIAVNPEILDEAGHTKVAPQMPGGSTLEHAARSPGQAGQTGSMTPLVPDHQPVSPRGGEQAQPDLSPDLVSDLETDLAAPSVTKDTPQTAYQNAHQSALQNHMERMAAPTGSEGELDFMALERAEQASHADSRMPAATRVSGSAPSPDIRAQVLTQMMQAPGGIKGDQRVVIQLDPPELGKVEIQFQQNGNQLTVTFLASSPEAEAALREGADELAEVILSRGRQWSDVQVRLEKNEPGNREHRQSGHDANERRGQQGGKERRHQR
jgi:flagellar hook-length control protein FliK